MNRLLIVLLSLCCSSSCNLFSSPVRAQDLPTSVAEKEHEWLQKFEGEWKTESEGTATPDQPSFQCKGTVKSKMLGKFWVINEIENDVQGVQMKGLQTIGYDSDSKKYVGTWVDNMMNHLWKYEGSVDENGKTLNLEADGPNFAEPGKIAKFRDAYEFVSDDHIIVTSSMQNADGKWVTFMTGHMHRVKK